jgi:hypothetical protein
MENIGGGKDQMPQDRRKEQESGKKAGQQSQGGSSKDWQSDKSGSQKDWRSDKSGSQRSGGSANEDPSNREGGGSSFGGRSGQTK